MSTLDDIEQGLRIGNAIGAPFAQAFLRKKQRQEQLSDRDQQLQLQMALMALQHPELGIKQTPSEFNPDLGERVGLPAALTPQQQTGLERGVFPKGYDPDIKPLLGGFAISPVARAQALQSALDQYKQKQMIEEALKIRELPPGAMLGTLDQLKGNQGFKAPEKSDFLSEEAFKQQKDLAGIRHPKGAVNNKLTPQQSETLKMLRSQRQSLNKQLDSTYDPNDRLKILRKVQDVNTQEGGVIESLGNLTSVEPAPSSPQTVDTTTNSSNSVADAIKWLEANPGHPKAKEVRAKINELSK